VRIAILSDVHGNIHGLDACLEDLLAQGGADAIVAAGDLCMDGPKPKKVLKRLREIGAQAIRGNTDRYIAEGSRDEDPAELTWYRDAIGPEWRAWLGALPKHLHFGREENALMISHANPKNDEEHVWPGATDAQLERLFGDVPARAFAFGHLHLPYVRMWRGRLITCVASAGLPKDGDPRAHYAILTEREEGWEVKSRRVPFDVEKVVKELKKSGHPAADACIVTLRRHRYKQLTGIVP
jgi:predicted phosphodiesterase